MFAGNSPAVEMTTSPALNGKARAARLTPCDVLVVMAISSGDALISAAANSRPRTTPSQK